MNHSDKMARRSYNSEDDIIISVTFTEPISLVNNTNTINGLISKIDDTSSNFDDSVTITVFEGNDFRTYTDIGVIRYDRDIDADECNVIFKNTEIANNLTQLI